MRQAAAGMVKCIPALHFVWKMIHMEIMFQKLGYFFVLSIHGVRGV